MTILAQISDTHLTVPVADDARSGERSDYFRRCVADINSLHPRPDAVIHTGDMTQNAYHDEYVLAREILSELEMPFFITPGNRDSRAEIRAVFSTDDYSPPDKNFIHYAVNIGSLRLVSVDTVNEGTREGDLCDKRIADVDATLSEAPDIPTVLFMHHPPFDVLTAKYPFQFLNREAVEKFVTVLGRHTQIEHVFCGHSHRCYTTEISDIRASTLPSIAADLRLGDYPESMNGIPLYKIHQYISGTGFVSETRLVTITQPSPVTGTFPATNSPDC